MFTKYGDSAVSCTLRLLVGSAQPCALVVGHAPCCRSRWMQPAPLFPPTHLLRACLHLSRCLAPLSTLPHTRALDTSIHLNKVMKFTMCSVDHAICVSNTCRENLVVRATLPPEKISTIPNAIDPSKFTPDPSARFPKGTINVVIMSRLVYRKGIDLVAPVVKVMEGG